MCSVFTDVDGGTFDGYALYELNGITGGGAKAYYTETGTTLSVGQSPSGMSAAALGASSLLLVPATSRDFVPSLLGVGSRFTLVR